MKVFKNAKVGDKVWDFVMGWGKIVSIKKNKSYPIKVKFNNTCDTYTLDGKLDKSSKNPSLFWNEFEIPEEACKKPLPDLEIDTKILVRDEEYVIWNEWKLPEEE